MRLSTRAPPAVAGQALGVGGIEHGEAHGLGQPPRRGQGELGVHGQARRQHVSGLFGGGPQQVERRPGPLGVHVVGRDRRDPAPVVDAGGQQRRQVVGEVGRRLHVDLGGQHQPGHRNGPLQVLGRAGGRLRHGRPRLGQEVLDDDLLHVAVPGVGRGDGPQRRQLPGPVVADPDQDPRGEGDGQLAGRLEGGQAPGRVLVGCTAVGGQPAGQRFDHHPLTGRHLTKDRQLVARQRSGVGVGEQAGLLDHQPAHGRQIVDRRRVPVRRQPVPGHRVTLLGLLAQGEEGLVATGRLPGPGDREDLLGRQVGRGQPGRRLGEGAVATAVAAQHGQRDEDLGREGDPPAVCLVTCRAGQRDEVDQGRVQEIFVGEHWGQSRGRHRWRRGPPATPSCRRAPERPGCRRRAAAGPRRPPCPHRRP